MALKEPLLTEPFLDTAEDADFPVVNEVINRLNETLDIKIYPIKKCLSRNHGDLCGCPLHYQLGGSCGEVQPGDEHWHSDSSQRRGISELT